MHQALSIARAQGQTPGAVEAIVNTAHILRLNWTPPSSPATSTTTPATTTHGCAVNRRFVAQGLYLPSVYSRGLQLLVIAIDTSASLSQDALALFWTHIRHLIQQTRPEHIHVVLCDRTVRDTFDYTSYHDVPQHLHLTGRGGTDFRPVFHHLETSGLSPSLCLYFTDLDCDDYPSHAPSFTTVWCAYDAPPDAQPPFGDVIHIPTT